MQLWETGNGYGSVRCFVMSYFIFGEGHERGKMFTNPCPMKNWPMMVRENMARPAFWPNTCRQRLPAFDVRGAFSRVFEVT